MKFWAEQETDLDLFSMKEVNYRLNPVSAEATITHSDIHDFSAPPQFQKAYSHAEVFKSPLLNPVKCKISTETGSEYYNLSLQDVRIANPVLTDIVKHEKQSLGTLKAVFYGYVLRIDEEEIIELVKECFGETGNLEKKEKTGPEFFGKEYYNENSRT